MAAEWYCKTPTNEEFGPFTSDELKKFGAEGRISPSMMVRKGAAGKWIPASKVKGLLDARPQPPPRILPLTPDSSQAKQSRKSPSLLLVVFLIASLFSIVIMLMLPGEKSASERVAETLLKENKEAKEKSEAMSKLLEDTKARFPDKVR